MNVIFVSQCEKKALNRTRRVLDAFASRIGDRTWQTIITEDGLIAVKTLLRKIATKNTAVACHWLRSRSRRDLVWIVGKRDGFDAQGVVMVNTTNKEVFMDILTDKPNNNMLYANTNLQSLIEHLFAVGYAAEFLHKRLMPNQEMQSMAIFIAGCLHDIGKIDPFFQEWVKNPKKKDFIAEDGQHIDDTKFSFDKHPRHNEISVLLYHLLDHEDLKEINEHNKEAIKHAIYWHHAKPFRKEKGFEEYGDICNKLQNNLNEKEKILVLFKEAIVLMEKLCELDAAYRNTDESVIRKVFKKYLDSDIVATIDNFDTKTLPLPVYKKYKLQDRIEEYKKFIENNAINNIMRASIVTADRLVSKLSGPELHSYMKNGSLETLLNEVLLVESNLYSNIESCLQQFPLSERSRKQSEVANKLAEIRDVDISVLAGPAGCGKTKIALEWAKIKKAQQIIWICPRVQICQGLFYDLTSDQYLPNAKIEINTGEFKFINKWDNKISEEDYFSGDIVITTIDQIFSSIITHTKVNMLITYLNAHIVFDEFHEYINMPAFNLLFAELIACKKRQGSQANTLLVSATPHYTYLRQILAIDSEDIIKMPSFNKSSYRIEFKMYDEDKQDNTNPLYAIQQPNTMVISNAAITAQKSFIFNQHQENAVLLHSKFKKSDKQKWFEEVYESFKKDGAQKFVILRSGPIVQASLNITCDHMVSEMTSAENMLQRLGRLDRFGKNLENTNVLIIAITNDVIQGKSKGSSSKFLNQMNLLQSSKAWYKKLAAELESKSVSLSRIYEIYEEFHHSEEGKKFIEEDLIKSLKQSVDLIDKKVIDPITIPKKTDKQKNRIKINKSSLRGDNRFVQMAVCDVSDYTQPKFINQYAYQMPIDEREDLDNLTASINEIKGYGDSNKDLLAHMQKKHHNIKKIKKAYNDFILLNEARDPEFPIYLSYTKENLDEVGGENARHPYAIYYAVCDKQPVGAISIKQLISNEE